MVSEREKTKKKSKHLVNDLSFTSHENFGRGHLEENLTGSYNQNNSFYHKEVKPTKDA